MFCSCFAISLQRAEIFARHFFDLPHISPSPFSLCVYPLPRSNENFGTIRFVVEAGFSSSSISHQSDLFGFMQQFFSELDTFLSEVVPSLANLDYPLEGIVVFHNRWTHYFSPIFFAHSPLSFSGPSSPQISTCPAEFIEFLDKVKFSLIFFTFPYRPFFIIGGYHSSSV
jgi:hypothetical protein